jgi:CelD/BcsL family acetyltransferase involved in cellulose biosynthesis
VLESQSNVQSASAQTLHAPSSSLYLGESANEAAQSVQIKTYSSWASLAEILPEWEAILRDNETLSIFSTPEWLRSWWEAFGANRSLAVLALYNRQNSLVGVAPFYFEYAKHPFLGRVKQLRLVGDGSGDSDSLDITSAPGEEETCVAAVLRWIAQQRNCGVCSLNTLPADSTVAKILAARLQEAKWPLRITSTPNSAIPLPSSWESYIESLAPKFRRLITRCRRKLEGQYQVRFRRCESYSEIPEMLETLYHLHQKRWNSVRQPGTFRSAERRDLYARMARAFFEKGWLELWSLELSGKAVAAQMSFRYRDRVYGLQEGFDTDYFSHNVGHVLRAGMFEYFINGGVRVYDFLGGTSAQKQRWGAEVGAYVNLQFAKPHSLASFSLGLDKGAAAGKEWLRHRLPPVVWSALHRINLFLTRKDETLPSKIERSPVSDAEEIAQGAMSQ